jgi:hypothetical protein
MAEAERFPWPDDPLIAAVVWKLPRAGEPFPPEARAAWLKMAAMAFDVAYGKVEDLPALLPLALERVAVPVAGGPAAEPKPIRQAHAGHDFYVALDGTACRADGTPAMIGDVPADEVIFDYRPVSGEFRDRDGIVWADGTRGTAGLAGGCSFCGPG